MGKDSQGIAASGGSSENNECSTCEAHNVSISPQEDRRRSKSAVGKVESREQNRGLGSLGACCRLVRRASPRVKPRNSLLWAHRASRRKPS
jgi:hypothetical protein